MMMRPFTRGLACLVLLGAVSLASASQGAEGNLVQLSANGTVEAQQDWLSVTLSATKEGNDASAVQTALRQTVDGALAELKKSAQAGSMEVRSGSFRLQPRYGNDGKVTGWMGSAELVLEGSDFARIGTSAAKAQGLVISNLRFDLSRQARAKLEGQAQELAITGFKARAAEIAKSFGFTTYGLREVSVGASDQPMAPMPRMMAMSSKAMQSQDAMPLESGKSLVMVTVSGTVQLK